MTTISSRPNTNSQIFCDLMVDLGLPEHLKQRIIYLLWDEGYFTVVCLDRGVFYHTRLRFADVGNKGPTPMSPVRRINPELWQFHQIAYFDQGDI